MVTLSSYLPTMPISRQELSETLSGDLLTLHQARAALSNAWAHRMSASLKAHFAAVDSAENWCEGFFLRCELTRAVRLCCLWTRF